MTPTGIEKLVCEDVAKRQALGIAKYGTTVADNPLSLYQWLEHAYQECLDQAVYLRRAMHEVEAVGGRDIVAARHVEAKPSGLGEMPDDEWEGW
jgi:hypothetical protein